MRRLGLVAALAALIACGAVTAMNRDAGARRDATRDVALASQTLAAAQLLERHIVDLETGLRGYVPTGDHVFLAPWYGGRAAIPSDYSTLRRLTIGEPGMEHELAAIERAVTAYTSGYATPLIARSPVTGRGLDTVTRRGKVLLDGVRAQLAEFGGAQLRVLRAAELRAEASQRRFSLVVIGSLIGLVLALLGLAFYIRWVVIVPVRRVIAACAELAAGRRSSDLRVSGAPELRSLAEAFNAMAAELETREGELLHRERMLATLRRLRTSARGSSTLPMAG